MDRETMKIIERQRRERQKCKGERTGEKRIRDE
jgi:hypothetical protein